MGCMQGKGWRFGPCPSPVRCPPSLRGTPASMRRSPRCAAHRRLHAAALAGRRVRRADVPGRPQAPVGPGRQLCVHHHAGRSGRVTYGASKGAREELHWSRALRPAAGPHAHAKGLTRSFNPLRACLSLWTPDCWLLGSPCECCSMPWPPPQNMGFVGEVGAPTMKVRPRAVGAGGSWRAAATDGGQHSMPRAPCRQQRVSALHACGGGTCAQPAALPCRVPPAPSPRPPPPRPFLPAFPSAHAAPVAHAHPHQLRLLQEPARAVSGPREPRCPPALPAPHPTSQPLTHPLHTLRMNGAVAPAPWGTHGHAPQTRHLHLLLHRLHHLRAPQTPHRTL
jgi:hypothetical protein